MCWKIKWNKLKSDARISELIQALERYIINEKHENFLFSIHRPVRKKVFHVSEYDLNEHGFRHWYSGTVNPKCAWRDGIKTTEHFWLHCLSFSSQRFERLDSLQNLCGSTTKSHSCYMLRLVVNIIWTKILPLK